MRYSTVDVKHPTWPNADGPVSGLTDFFVVLLTAFEWSSSVKPLLLRQNTSLLYGSFSVGGTNPQCTQINACIDTKGERSLTYCEGRCLNLGFPWVSSLDSYTCLSERKFSAPWRLSYGKVFFWFLHCQWLLLVKCFVSSVFVMCWSR